MSSAHFIYIPLVVLAGVVIGFILGGRATRDAMNLERKRDAEIEAAKAARVARRKERDAARGEGASREEPPK